MMYLIGRAGLHIWTRNFLNMKQGCYSTFGLLGMSITIVPFCKWDNQTWSIYCSLSLCMPIQLTYLGLFICGVFIVAKAIHNYFEYQQQFWSSPCKMVQTLALCNSSVSLNITNLKCCFLNIQCQREKLYMQLLWGI